ncbi:MAG: aminopeptidase N [Pseudomonadota bacterium]
MRTSQGQAIYLKNYREPEYQIPNISLMFDLQINKTRVVSEMTIERLKATKPGTPLILDGDELTLISISINGNTLSSKDYKLDDAGITIINPPSGKTFDLKIETEINPEANTQLMGLYRSGGNYCTQCEAEGFRRITYFLDRPDVLSVFTTRIEADKKDAPVILGNGNPVKSGAADGGRHFAVWHDPFPKPSYLFALVAGKLDSIFRDFQTASGKPVKLGIYVEKGKSAQAEYAMDALIRSMRWDEKRFGCEYDLDVFNIVAVSDFNMGAMENKGLNIFNDKYVLADRDSATDTDYANIEAIIAHEYFHNWTGNRITCRDWFQLCLKEGLTVYRDQEFSSDERSRAVQRIADVRRLKTAQFPEDAGPLAHPVRPEHYREINNFYTATVYEKGAELVRMLATLLGEKQFRKGMDLYFRKHDGEATTIESFISCFEKAAKSDLSQFMLWYRQAGTPVLNVSTSYDRTSKRFSLELEQFTPPTPGQRRKSALQIPLQIALLGKDGETITGNKISGGTIKDGLLELSKRKHKVVFHDLEERPVLSINRGFSAPININFRQSAADLAFLARNDTDTFCRWDALQNYATRLLISGTRGMKAGKKQAPDERFLEICTHIAKDDTLDPAYRAALLTLPSDIELAGEIDSNVDPQAIHSTIKVLQKQIGQALSPFHQSLMDSLQEEGEFDVGSGAAGKRSLRAVLLKLSVICGSKTALQDIQSAYDVATNMTDRFNAFATIVHFHPSPAVRGDILEDFYQRYKNNHIVLDKWFTVQATRPDKTASNKVKSLMRHPDFSFSNPNRLRSLIGAFAMSNQIGFAAENGKGFELVLDTIEKLDQKNPQVAARLLTAFRSYRTLEPVRRKKARSLLEKLNSVSNLSTDVRDIITRTLGE